MKVHVFHYKWPRIKEGLIHEEQEVLSKWQLTSINGNKNHFLLFDNVWYGRVFNPTEWARVDIEKVPKPIRAMALILTN